MDFSIVAEENFNKNINHKRREHSLLRYKIDNTKVQDIIISQKT